MPVLAVVQADRRMQQKCQEQIPIVTRPGMVKKPPGKLKKGKTAGLAAKTSAGVKIAWKSTTKKKCAVKIR